jgi:hypothetical protein
MNPRRVLVLVLVLGMSSVGPHVAQAEISAELQPTLQYFSVVSRPMPVMPGYYDAVPDSQGRLVQGIGHSSWVRGWYHQSRQVAPKLLAIDERLRLDLNVFADTVREQGELVLKSTRGSFKQSLKDLDVGTGQRLQVLLAQYNDEVGKALKAKLAHERGKRDAEAAQFGLRASDADAQECSKILEKAKLEADKAALQAKMAKGQVILNAIEKAIGAMAEGPQGVASYLMGEAKSMTVEGAKAVILDAFFASERESLYQIGLKLEAIDKALQDLKCQKQEFALKQAKAHLEGRMLDVVRTFGESAEHRARAWRTVDMLATLQEKHGRPLAVFRELNTYNAQVNLMGRKVFDSVSSYQQLLAREPLSRGDIMYDVVTEDINTVRRERDARDPSGKWLDVASAVHRYFGTYSYWYKAEVKRAEAALDNLREGRHLDLVDKIVARATRELGGTVSYEDLIR